MRNDMPAVGAERDAADHRAVVHPRPDRLAGVRVPHLGRLILAGGHHPAAVRAERGCVKDQILFEDRRDRFAGRS